MKDKEPEGNIIKKILLFRKATKLLIASDVKDLISTYDRIIFLGKQNTRTEVPTDCSTKIQKIFVILKYKSALINLISVEGRISEKRLP